MGWKWTAFKWILFAVIIKVFLSIANHPAPQGSDTWTIKFNSWLTVQIWTIGQYYGHRYNMWSSVDLGRALTNSMVHHKQDEVKEEWADFDGVPVKMFYPKKLTKRRGLIYIHGGGWTVGRADAFDSSMARFAIELNAVVASIEYPLRPENSLDDMYGSCVTASKYFITNAKKWNVDSKRVTIIGESAGGNLVASTTLALRDENFQPMPKLHCVLNGPVQFVDVSLPSYQQNKDGPLMFYDLVMTLMSSNLFGTEYEKYKPIFLQQRHVPKAVRDEMAKDHVGEAFVPPEQRYPPYKKMDYQDHDEETWKKFGEAIMSTRVSPLFGKNFTGMPEGYVVSAQYDMIRDEGYLWARKLRQWGIPVTHYNDPVGFHANMFGGDKFVDGAYAMDTLIAFIDKKL